MGRAGPRFTKATKVHRHAWVWESLETDPGFVLGSMFGIKVAYLDGRLMLCFAEKSEPWRGVLVCTDRDRQGALIAQFPSLEPHPVLPKWLYLPESSDTFERDALKLAALAKARDPRIGVLGGTRARARAKAKRTR
jgi:hypothetical protein